MRTAHARCPWCALLRAKAALWAQPLVTGLTCNSGGCAVVQGKVVNSHVQCPYHGAPRHCVNAGVCLRVPRASRRQLRWN